MATQQQTDVDEEGVRLIKVFRPAKDAETLFKIDIVSELALYIHMLQSGGDYTGMFENEGPDTSFASSMASKLDTSKGVNFAHATTVVMEATRIYSKKVDFLRQQMDLALVNLSSGNLTKATKMNKQKARTLKSNVKGISALSDWLLPEINDATELLHLPWAKWAKSDSHSSNNLILPDEVSIHADVASFMRPLENESLENFALRLATKELPSFQPRPRSSHIRLRAERKRQCILRPLVELMPRQEISLTLDNPKSTSIDTQILRNHLVTSKLMSAKMHHTGLLYTPISQHLLNSETSLNSTMRKDYNIAATPHLGNSIYAQSKSPNLPDTSRLFCPSTRHSIPTQGMENNDPGTVQNKSTFRATPSAQTYGQSSILGEEKTRRLKPIVRAKEKPIYLLDEHAICGKDVSARYAKSFSRPNLDIYNIEVDKITSLEIARIILKGRSGVQDYLKEDNCGKRRIHQDVSAWKVEHGFLRSVKKSADECVPASLPFFDDVKKNPSRLEQISERFDFSSLQCLVNESRKRVMFKVSSEVAAESEVETEPGKPNEGDDVWEDPAEFDASIFRSHGPPLDETMASPTAQLAESSLVNDAMCKARDVIYHMHQRVGLWRERVEEWIVSSSALGTFNVAEYIQKIAERLRGMNGEQSSLSFAQIVPPDCPRHEVCRTFLTTLMLANKHGFKLEQDLNRVQSDGKINLIVHFGAVHPDELTADHFDGVQDAEKESGKCLEDKEESSVTSRKRSRCVDSASLSESMSD